MPKEILCPICGASYNLADAQLGRKVRCKKCEHTFTAGGDHQDPDDEEDEELPRAKKGKKGRDRDEDDDDDRPKKRKSLAEQVKQREQEAPGMPISSFVIMGIVAAVILICGGGVGLYFLIHKDNTPTTKQQGNPPNKQSTKQPNKR
jgi:predicted Zn finger-like uncharacterized protein